MANLEYLLWAYFIFYPLYGYFNHEKEQQRITLQPHLKIAFYRSIMVHIWLPTLVVVVLYFAGELSLKDIGLTWQWHLANILAIALIIVIVAYFFLALKKLNNNEQARQSLLLQIAHVSWFMPTSKKESQYFILGVAVSAGICEEVLFRAFLLHSLSQYLPIYGAVLISSLAFGLGHIYQGWSHVLKISIYGAAMALLYLITNSILVPILIHLIVDMFSGAMAYKVYSMPVTKKM
jgi:uncharacterized protein